MEDVKPTTARESILVYWFSSLIEFGYRWCNVSRLLLMKSPEKIFRRVEIMMLFLTALCIGIYMTIGLMPVWLAKILCILLIQRVIEFVIIYSRHFILNKGLIFSHFHDPNALGQWLILMFGLSLTQVVLAFSTWYQFLSKMEPASFTQPLDVLGSLYFSMVTFLTIGYGDISPVLPLARILMILQGTLSFYVVVIVINGMISLHFATAANTKKED